jgi:hypothetical protein
MIAHYNLRSTSRKELAIAVSEIMNTPLEYKGAPSFDYAVGDFTIGKYGELSGELTQELLDTLAERGFVDPESGRAFILEELMEEPVELYIPELAPQRNYDCDYYYDGPSPNDAPERLTIEMPMEGFNETSLTNLERMIASKSELIKKAIGSDELLIEKTDTTIKFPWFSSEATGDEVNAYSHFVSALCKVAKEHSRVTAKEKPVENEKFAFRVFLIRLGFVGNEYKVARKILLKNLAGNSAFKNGKPQTEVSEDE